MDNEGKLIKIVGLLNETKVAAVEAKRQISSMRDRLAEFREQQQRTYERLSASLHALRDLVNDNLRANVNVRVVNNVVGGEIEDDCESVITVENDLMEEEEEEEADEVESDESDTAAGDTTFSADGSTQKFSPRRDPPIKSLAVRALALVLSNSISSLNCNAPVVNNNGAEIEECESGITVENDLMEEEEVDKEEEESDEVQMEKE
ncbi:hypothetical protein G4B88_029791 [Cannabis sativa]|uniref:Uncharacterized protein n=1 Tax=Cannabis sativa TaxID=3483 RepID=A0A7J6GEP5_CANSA|nr:hypothetical protein G4B88_029791 [Cannabis sativa]